MQYFCQSMRMYWLTKFYANVRDGSLKKGMFSFGHRPNYLSLRIHPPPLVTLSGDARKKTFCRDTFPSTLDQFYASLTLSCSTSTALFIVPYYAELFLALNLSHYITVYNVEASDRNLELEIRGIMGTTVTKRRTFDALTRHLERQICLNHRVKKRGGILDTDSWA